MINAPNYQTMKQARTAIKAVRGRIRLLMPLLVSALFLLVLTPAAPAFKVISEPGEGAGQNDTSTGLAVDYETGRLYIADKENNRVDVFDAIGAFEKAFGWGVDNGANKPETCTVATTCRKGLRGEGNGEFGGPTAVAVDNSCFLHKPEPLTGAACAAFDPSDGDVYVVDQASQRVEKFDSEGGFILTIGGGVDKTVPGNVCTEESKHACGAGADGFGEGEFSSSAPIFVGVGPGGVVYVVDSLQPEGNIAKNSKSRLQKFEASGTEIAPEHILFEEEFAASALAVNSAGDFYVTNGPIREYGPTGGPPIDEIEEPEAQEGTGIGAALTVDSEDDLFAASSGSGASVSVMELDPAGNPLSRFGYGTFLRAPLAIAPYHSASGDIYASEELGEFIPFGGRVVHLDLPKPGPLVFPEPCEASPLGNTTATLSAKVNPEGKATSYHFEYVTDSAFQEDVTKLGAGHGFDRAKRLPEHEGEDPSLAADFTLHPASVKAALVPETRYHCRVVPTNANAPSGNAGEEGVFTSLPPVEIGPGWTSSVGTQTATLNATVNPLGIPTTGFFEYVDEATYQKDIAELGANRGFDHAIKAPDEGEPLDFDEESSFTAGATTVLDLKAGTSYRYRLIATDSYFPAGFDGPTEAFRTYDAGEGPLPDDRTYELVSPGQKNSAEVAVPSVVGGLINELNFVRIQAAAGSGEAISYTSWTSFGNPEGAPAASQYLSKRTPSGWGTENISPFGSLQGALAVPYRGFTPDLRLGAFVTDEPPLTAEAQQGFENLYLRDNSTGHIQALTIDEPQPGEGEGEGFCTGYAGASSDGSHAFFSAKGAMTGSGALLGKGFSLYEWSAGGGLALVSVLPDGAPAPPVKASEGPGNGTGFGAVGGNCTMDHGVVHNAVSTDGQTAFWNYGGEYEGIKDPLFARIDGKETIELDGKPTVKAGSGPFGQGTFKAATGDGSKAFFTAPGKLTVGATKGDLYRYDTLTHTLTDLIPGTVAPEIEGVIGASEDGTYAYFVAEGALTGEEENAAGEKATHGLGRSNLYVWHEGQGLRFIATLGADEGDWQSVPESLSARLTPDGRHLAFLSVETEALSGYNNTIFPGTECHPIPYSSGLNKEGGGPRCAEAYLYDAEANKLVCASCNPAGSRPTGPTQLPGWSNPYEGPRYLSDDGSRLYFESRDALTAADKNAKRDVYEFEQAGTGSCTTGNPALDPATGGCHFLVSSGKSADESYLIDASADGRDVFFSTRQPLLGWDTNENYDVYDARENGGFPEPPEQQPPCLDENCKAPASLLSSPFSPKTATFFGAGNLAPHAVKVSTSKLPLTRSQKLAKALKACKSKRNKRKHASCEKSARRQYGRRK